MSGWESILDSFRSSTDAPKTLVGQWEGVLAPKDDTSKPEKKSGWGSIIDQFSVPGGDDTDFGEEWVINGLVERGMPEHIAEGFAMNFKDESGFNPDINEINPIVPGSRGGYGFYQLTGPRRRAYEAYAAQKGIDLRDRRANANAQLDFLMMEIEGPERAAWSRISQTSTSGEAGAAIVNHFLRPAEQHRAHRANKYLQVGGGPDRQAAETGLSTQQPVQRGPAPDLSKLWLTLGDRNG